jgi:hypothetical protein
VPHPNACLTCDDFLTTAEFLPTTASNSNTPRSYRQTRERGNERVVEMNVSRPIEN